MQNTHVTKPSPLLLTEREACSYLGVSRSFLAKSRMNGPLRGQTPGPPFIKLGRAVRYSIADLDRWVAEHRHLMRGGWRDAN